MCDGNDEPGGSFGRTEGHLGDIFGERPGLNSRSAADDRGGFTEVVGGFIDDVVNRPTVSNIATSFGLVPALGFAIAKGLGGMMPEGTGRTSTRADAHGQEITGAGREDRSQRVSGKTTAPVIPTSTGIGIGPRFGGGRFRKPGVGLAL